VVGGGDFVWLLKVIDGKMKKLVTLFEALHMFKFSLVISKVEFYRVTSCQIKAVLISLISLISLLEGLPLWII
jgi:hypothetical protein